MVLERTIEVKSYADRDLQEKLNALQQEVAEAMRVVFGMKMPYAAVARFEKKSELSDEELVGDLLKKGKAALEAQQKQLWEADKISDAAAMDLSFGEQGLTITDFERALEFIDETNPRKNADSFKKVWDFFVHEALSNLDDLSQMPYSRPGLLFPNPRSFTPVFGFADRATWNSQQQELRAATKKRIEEVNLSVKKKWLEVDERARQAE